MLKYLLIIVLVIYILRRFIFAPLPGSSRHQRMQQDKKDTIQYSDYEEIE